MARRAIRIDIPKFKPNEFVKLAKEIIEQHNTEGNNSPLNQLEMDEFITKTTEAEAAREEAKKLRGRSEALMQRANVLLGLAEDQNCDTPDTVYHIMLKIRDLLLVYNQNYEENLSLYGFNVVIKSFRVGRRKKESNPS